MIQCHGLRPKGKELLLLNFSNGGQISPNEYRENPSAHYLLLCEIIGALWVSKSLPLDKT